MLNHTLQDISNTLYSRTVGSLVWSPDSEKDNAPGSVLGYFFQNCLSGRPKKRWFRSPDKLKAYSKWLKHFLKHHPGQNQWPYSGHIGITHTVFCFITNSACVEHYWTMNTITNSLQSYKLYMKYRGHS
jgi:hypothetical protein